MSVFSSTLGGAASGAVIGSAIPIPGVGTAVGAAVGGLLGFLGGRAQDEAAQGQQQIAMAQLQQARADRMLALQYAGASPNELAGQQRLLELQNMVLGRTNRELEYLSSGLDARSPGASEAGRGLFSEYIMRQRGVGRSNLESELRRRFGAGYATTSAGMAALSQYDQATSDIGVRAIPTFLETAYRSVREPMNFENLVKGRQVTALTGTPLTQYSGAENLAGVLRSQGTARDINELMGTAVSAGIGYGLYGKNSAWNK